MPKAPRTSHSSLVGLYITSLVLATCKLGFAVPALGPVPPWPTKVISWWYACDNEWPAAIKMINTPARLPLVTSVQTYCGWDISDSGKLIGETSPACLAFFKQLTPLGVRAEIATGAGNCSIATYRKLWADKIVSPQQLLTAALAANVTGWNIDLEPQANNCQGGPGPVGTAADAKLFASWLSAVREVLNPHGIRLTVDVASWSPVLDQFAILAPAVDRLQNMETYNGASQLQWEGYFDEFVSKIPVSAAGVGLGAWNVSGAPQWWETSAAAEAKVARSIKAKVPELALFRIVPATAAMPYEWPLPHWWTALEPFIKVK